ncbi:2981_t:CDS:2 [Cetraspora pellucida]|uniref:2981_t:CDS:1 n=1 Tax=Cetraspora pellucida TaxID=1433469 RepID=A0ACA9MIE5_9GLOM|nr:2981_t:CDS:2 [Cetraspora pellucida]
MHGTTKKRKHKTTNSTAIQDSQDEAPVGTVFQLDLSNRSSWVWEFFCLEIRKEDDGWWGRYGICKIEILVGVECGRTYRTESSTGNLIGHLLADHEVTKDNSHPKEHPLFRRFINKLDPAFTISDVKLVKQIIHHTYNYCVSLLRDHLKENAIKVSLTIDLWTAKNWQGFFGVTCSYIDQQFHLNEVTLTIQHVQYPHTVNNIYETVENIIRYWNLMGKVHSITTDNALKYKKVCSKDEWSFMTRM